MLSLRSRNCLRPWLAAPVLLTPVTAFADSAQTRVAPLTWHGWLVTPDLVTAGILAGGICLLCLAAAVPLVQMLRRPDRATAQGRGAVPTTGAALVAQAAPKNKMMAFGVLGFSLAMFVSAFLIGVLSHLHAHAGPQTQLAHTVDAAGHAAVARP